MTLRATKVNISIILWLFFFCLWTLAGWGCDAGDFVHEEFGVRCQNMGEMVKTLLAVQRMDVPDQTKARAAIANEWVSFYLSHGEESPASFTEVLPGAWKRSMAFVGQQLSDLLYGNLSFEDGDDICVVFDMIALQNLLSSAHGAMGEWGRTLALPVGESLEVTTEWLGVNLNSYMILTQIVGEEYSGLTAKSKRFMELIKRRWVEVLRADGAIRDTLYRMTRTRLAEEFLREYERFKLITLFEEGGAAIEN